MDGGVVRRLERVCQNANVDPATDCVLQNGFQVFRYREIGRFYFNGAASLFQQPVNFGRDGSVGPFGHSDAIVHKTQLGFVDLQGFVMNRRTA